MVREQPRACELEVLAPGVAHLDELARQLAEAKLRVLERHEVGRRHFRSGNLRSEALELSADKEGLAELVPREHANANATVGLEAHEAERREPPERLAHRRPRHLELLGQVLLAEDAARRNLARDDRLLERERDVVRFVAVGHQ
ncbi:MAG: hypothetical protein HW413_2199 [Thermoleophilia bacterium]|nr:hypothetical protein [Thermoleophilia bacterium]